MTLQTKVIVSMNALLTGVQDLASAEVPLSLRQALVLADGAGAGMADRIFHDRRTIAASGSDSLDLAGGLSDPLGVSLSFARLKVLLVRAAAANVNQVLVGGAASNAFAAPFGDATDKIKIPPGGTLLLAAGQADATGYAVTASTADLLLIGNGGAGSSVTYDIVLIGASA
ncbi:hypothetical protein ACLQ2R_03175 [Streptosporangium sp. DT93]|uniref:hypothetical protein n=1 Tax=Streptosporangium sp. DT93 TaxID=3393428 RepID=UPI003CE84036